MNEIFKSILKSLQLAKKYIFHCFVETKNVLDNTNKSDALNDSDKNEIKNIIDSPIWRGWTLSIITLLQNLIIFEPNFDDSVKYTEDIPAELDDGNPILVSMHDLRNCIAHNMSDEFFSKVDQQKFVFRSKINNTPTNYSITFENLITAMSNIESEILKIIS